MKEKELFDSFCAHFEGRSEESKVELAFQFWKRIGDTNAQEMAIDNIAISSTLKTNPAGDILAQAKEGGHSTEEIEDAILYSIR